MTIKTFRVKYVHENPGVHTGNILWDTAYEMRSGKFPPNHPCCPGDSGMNGECQFGQGPAIEAFRARGYWASCFPEGDGITMTVKNGQSPDQVVRDIEECFGWKVKYESGHRETRPQEGR